MSTTNNFIFSPQLETCCQWSTEVTLMSSLSWAHYYTLKCCSFQSINIFNEYKICQSFPKVEGISAPAPVHISHEYFVGVATALHYKSQIKQQYNVPVTHRNFCCPLFAGHLALKNTLGTAFQVCTDHW